MSEINPSQITFARVRRKLTKAQLAKELGVTSRSIQNYEAGASTPDSETLAQMAKLLNFPQQFFYIEERMPTIAEHAASFRSLSKMTDGMKNCALSAGAIAFKINEWMEARFNLPRADLPDLRDLSPEEAAATLRRMWGLGNAPIPNMIHLLESKGIRVFSLAEEAREVDAFCTWYDCKPFVFLNTMKSAERSRFDAAHELGHLVRDVYSMQHGEAQGSEMERQADAFASAFLMPKESVITNKPPAFTLKYLMKLKHYWGVSLAALAYRYNSLSQVTEWTYRNLCIEIAKNGYRSNEPEPMERESSQLLSKVLDFLQSQKLGRAEIAKSLSISVDEINALTFALTRLSIVPGDSSTEIFSGKQQPKLRLV
jgi:Zn-dependent peptidase ImmA (M78 family)/DNA-binding XRE family transcriptional regulator